MYIDSFCIHDRQSVIKSIHSQIPLPHSAQESFFNTTRNGRVQETTRRWLPQETICEKEKGESRQQAALYKGGSIVWGDGESGC